MSERHTHPSASSASPSEGSASTIDGPIWVVGVDTIALPSSHPGQIRDQRWCLLLGRGPRWTTNTPDHNALDIIDGAAYLTLLGRRSSGIYEYTRDYDECDIFLGHLRSIVSSFDLVMKTRSNQGQSESPHNHIGSTDLAPQVLQMDCKWHNVRRSCTGVTPDGQTRILIRLQGDPPARYQETQRSRSSPDQPPEGEGESRVQSALREAQALIEQSANNPSVLERFSVDPASMLEEQVQLEVWFAAREIRRLHEEMSHYLQDGQNGQTHRQARINGDDAWAAYLVGLNMLRTV